jgi:predicted lipoprotein with Yx(FWY)xxD motif
MTSERKVMKLRKSATLLIAAIPVLALAAAACSGGGSATGIAAPTTSSGQPVAVGVASTTLGQILVNPNGRTLYLFQGDSGTTSNCSGACASAWPPLRVSSTTSVGTGANASLLGSTPRSDGAPQVTYNGHPVYLFIKDQKAGDTNGQGVTAFGALWYALSPAGNAITAAVPSSSGSASGGAGGY